MSSISSLSDIKTEISELRQQMGLILTHLGINNTGATASTERNDNNECDNGEYGYNECGDDERDDCDDSGGDFSFSPPSSPQPKSQPKSQPMPIKNTQNSSGTSEKEEEKKREEEKKKEEERKRAEESDEAYQRYMRHYYPADDPSCDDDRYF